MQYGPKDSLVHAANEVFRGVFQPLQMQMFAHLYLPPGRKPISRRGGNRVGLQLRTFLVSKDNIETVPIVKDPNDPQMQHMYTRVCPMGSLGYARTEEVQNARF